MNSNRRKGILFIIILSVAFLIESPFKLATTSALSFSQPLAQSLNLIFYAALFVCFLITFKSETPKKPIFKSICIVLAFVLFEQIMSAFFINAIFGLIYEIIRPLLIVLIILWANRWIVKSRIDVNKTVIIAIGVLWLLNALLMILDFIQMMGALQALEYNIHSYVNLLAASNSIYNVLANFSNYALAYVALFHSNKSTKE